MQIAVLVFVILCFAHMVIFNAGSLFYRAKSARYQEWIEIFKAVQKNPHRSLNDISDERFAAIQGIPKPWMVRYSDHLFAIPSWLLKKLKRHGG